MRIKDPSGRDGFDTEDPGDELLGTEIMRCTTSEGPGIATDAASTSADEPLTVYRGTFHSSEIDVFHETGHVLSSAARTAYKESDSLDEAYAVAARLHADWVADWGDEATPGQAHGALGGELGREFGRPRTFVSVSGQYAVAEHFAGRGGSVVELRVRRSAPIPQTLHDAGEDDYLIRYGIQPEREVVR